jgi:RNA polymerase sigma factor (sigma-70 family)
MVWRVCRGVLRNSHDAEDAFQATFLVLVRRAGAIRRQDSVASWLYGVALRVASCARSAMIRRRDHERRRGAAMVASIEVDPGSSDWSLALHEELGRLPGRFRDVAVLCLVESNTHEEAARRLGCPVGTVKSRLATARLRLRRRLERRGLAPSAGLVTAILAEEAEAALAPPSALVEATIRAAMRVAAKQAAAGGMVSSSVAALTEGVLKAMLISKLKVVALSTVAIGLLGIGVAWAQQQPAPEQAQPEADRFREVERKLDRVLEALGNPGSRPSGGEVTKAVPHRGRNFETTKPETVPASPFERPNPEPTGSMRDADRLDRLERKVDELSARLDRLEKRADVQDRARAQAGENAARLK